jgi:hypothetical protein
MMYLTEPTLGQLDLDCDPEGYVVSQFDIGFPTARPVVRLRALADGVLDTSRFVGQRAITVSITLDQTKMATQDLLDKLMPYLSPRYRPRIVYSIQEPVTNPSHVRSFEIRGVDAPLVIDGPKFQTVVCQWVALDHRATSVNETCRTLFPTSDQEFGREYDLEFDRDYPPSAPAGVTNITMAGNDPADWVAEIVGGVEDPILVVNGVRIEFTNVTLTTGQLLVIDTRNRTMIQGGNLSVYGDSNFVDWEWDDLLLRPGVNTLRYDGTNLDADSFTLFCWYDTWL